jgi:hypothetical protein
MARKFGKAISGGAVTTSTGVKVQATVTPQALGKTAISGVRVSFKGTSPTAEPIEIIGTVATLSGGAGSSSATVSAMDASDSTALQTTALKGYSTDPTLGTPVEVFRVAVHPQAGYVHREEIRVPAGRAFVLSTNAAAAVNHTWEIAFEE